METHITNFGDGESENATLRDFNEVESNTRDQSAQQDESAQANLKRTESEEYKNDEESDDQSNDYSDADHDDFGRNKRQHAQFPTYCAICLKTTDMFKCVGCGDSE